MKQIVLDRIEIRNFKGIEKLDINLGHRTEIYGRNGLGKTSILDAFLWCLFGKDSTGASNFSVKPIGSDGKVKPYHDVDVMCKLRIDNVDLSLRRRWVEKRSKRDGSLKGNTGEYFVNEASVSNSEYTLEVSRICEENLFMLITSTGALNRMNDADRRKILAGMSSIPSDIDISVEFPHIYDALQSGKTIESYKEEIKGKKALTRIELDQYPIRLRENADSRPALPDDIDQYDQRIKEREDQLKKIDEQIGSEDPQEAKKAQLRDEIASLEKDIRDIENTCRETLARNLEDHKRQLDEIEIKLANAQALLNRSEELVKNYETTLIEHDASLKKIQQEWTEINQSKIDPLVVSVCPTCGKPFSQSEIEMKTNEIIRSFNCSKLQKLEEIDKRGAAEVEFIKKFKEYKQKAQQDLEVSAQNVSKLLEEKKAIASKQQPTLSLVLSANREYQKLRQDAELKNQALLVASTPSDLEIGRFVERERVETDLKRMKAELWKVSEIQRLDERKAELEKKQMQAATNMAELECIEAEILAFSMKKTGMIEESISSKFRFVKFKMFEYNLTNDGVREVCICTVDGVPYRDLNTAMQYNADIDIINALSNHYKVIAPIFIDRAESVNQIEETKSQRIDLYASKEDKVLRIHTL